MSDKQSSDSSGPDFSDAFRQIRDTYVDAWSKAMVDAVNSDAYAKATGMMLNNYLAAASPFREAVEKVMLQALQQFSMPSRADVMALSERAVNIEMRLDDLDAKIDRIEKLLVNTRSTKAKRKRVPVKSNQGKGAE